MTSSAASSGRAPRRVGRINENHERHDTLLPAAEFSLDRSTSDMATRSAPDMTFQMALGTTTSTG